jgi:hypothetical protein
MKSTIILIFLAANGLLITTSSPSLASNPHQSTTDLSRKISELVKIDVNDYQLITTVSPALTTVQKPHQINRKESQRDTSKKPSNSQKPSQLESQIGNQNSRSFAMIKAIHSHPAP